MSADEPIGGDLLPSILRTGVPAMWGTALGALAKWGILDPAAAEDVAVGLTGPTIVVATGVVYYVARKVERYLPQWATRILLGSARRPVAYTVPLGRS